MASEVEIVAAAKALFDHSEKHIRWDQLSGATRKAWCERARKALDAAARAKRRRAKQGAAAPTRT